MSEVRPIISQLLLTHPDRVAVDECLEVMRQNETSPSDMLSEDPYEMNRDASRYVTELLGLQHLFNYVRQSPIPKMVLDIGAGRTVAAAQFSRSVFGRQLDFHATTLTRKRMIDTLPYLPDDKQHLTSVEYLDGIETESMGGIIGVWSIFYSKFPGYAIRRVDQVLAPGGVFKSMFLSEPLKSHPEWQTYYGFLDELQRLGYDCSRKWYGMKTVVTALKPTENPVTTAAKLAMADYLSWESQAQAMRQLIMLESP